MDETPPRRKRLRGWWGIVAAIVVLLLAIVGGVWWWYTSTADLETVRAQAKLHGIPVTWADSGMIVAPADQVAAMERLKVLSSILKDYNSSTILSSKKLPRLKPFLPIPQEAIDHHAAFDPMLLKEFLDLIDGLPAHPVIMSIDRTIVTPLSSVEIGRAVTRVLGERILLAPREQLPTEVRRCLRFISAMEQRSWIEVLVKTSLLAIATERIAGRRDEAHALMPDLVPLLVQADSELEASLLHSSLGEFVIANHSIEHLDEIRVGMGGLAASGTWDVVWLKWTTRAGRGDYLNDQLAWIGFLRGHPTSTSLLAEAARFRQESEELRHWMPDETLRKMVLGALPHVITAVVTMRLRLQVMISDLSATPWPNDPFDPAGNPLRRVERDGRTMGAYTVYENGRDDGGKHGDKYFPLYGPLEPPVSTGP